MKPTHKAVIAFVLGWLLSLFLNPRSLFGRVQAAAS